MMRLVVTFQNFVNVPKNCIHNRVHYLERWKHCCSLTCNALKFILIFSWKYFVSNSVSSRNGFHCEEFLMVLGFHCTLCQCSVVLQTSNEIHILIFSSYSTQVGAASNKPHFLTSDFLSLVHMIMTEPYASRKFSHLVSWKAISWQLPGNADFYVGKKKNVISARIRIR
jgi:hypothetical protein